MKLQVIIILGLLSVSTLFGQGIVIDEQFFSEALDAERNFSIYLPEDYDPDERDVLYPVIYLLHGGGVDYTYYSEIVPALDSLIGESIEPVIVVRPDGYYGPYSGMSWWANSELNGNFEDFIVYDLVDYVEAFYNVSQARSKRCIVGHSMGGYGAMMIALKHPDRYCGVVSFSGIVHLSFTVQEYWLPEMLEENGGGGPYNPQAGLYTQVIFSVAAALTPNLNNPPYYVDLPVDNEGNYIDEVFDRWIREDPAWLATQLVPEETPGIYIDACENEGGFTEINDVFADTLDAHDIGYVKRVFPGNDHHRDLPQRYPTVLAFLDSLMHSGDEAVPLNGELNSINDFRLLPAYPNPFNSTTTIRYSLPYPSQVSLQVFDISGRKVNTLFEGLQQIGWHSTVLNAGKLPSGVIFIKLQTSDRTEIGSIITQK